MYILLCVCVSMCLDPCVNYTECSCIYMVHKMSIKCSSYLQRANPQSRSSPLTSREAFIFSSLLVEISSFLKTICVSMSATDSAQQELFPYMCNLLAEWKQPAIQLDPSTLYLCLHKYMYNCFYMCLCTTFVHKLHVGTLWRWQPFKCTWAHKWGTCSVASAAARKHATSGEKTNCFSEVWSAHVISLRFYI